MRDSILPISVGLGTALGAAFSNIPLGAAIGAAIGVVLKTCGHKDE